jgi:hypothetical protein
VPIGARRQTTWQQVGYHRTSFAPPACRTCEVDPEAGRICSQMPICWRPGGPHNAPFVCPRSGPPGPRGRCTHVPPVRRGGRSEDRHAPWPRLGSTGAHSCEMSV